MSLPTRKGSKCAICAFVASERLATLTPKHYGARFSSQLAPQSRGSQVSASIISYDMTRPTNSHFIETSCSQCRIFSSKANKSTVEK
jgi:hypothetical protein